MAVHEKIEGLLRESLPEHIIAAEGCLNYVKDENWGINQKGGCLGYPAATLLFCIANTIGSFHEDDREIKIIIESKRQVISNTSQHLFILNSFYYQQSLSEKAIKRIHDNFRSLLAHNASLAFNHYLHKDSPEPDQIFDKSGKHVYLIPFLEASKNAVNLFLKDVDVIVPNSNQYRDIQKKQ